MTRRKQAEPVTGSKLKKKQKEVSDSIVVSQTVVEKLEADKKVLEGEIKSMKVKKEEGVAALTVMELEVAKFKEKNKGVSVKATEMKADLSRIEAVISRRNLELVRLTTKHEEQEETAKAGLVAIKEKATTEGKALSRMLDALAKEVIDIKSTNNDLMATKTKIIKSIEQNKQTVVNLESEINSKNIDIVKKSELLSNKESAAKNAQKIVDELNSQIADGKQEAKNQKEAIDALVFEKDDLATELDKNKRINLALIKKGERIPALLSTIEEVYREAGLEISLPK